MGGPTLTLRPAKPGDREGIDEVLRAAGRVGWSDILPPAALRELRAPAAWDDALGVATGPRRILVADDEGRVAGFAVVRPSEDPGAGPGVGEIEALYTDPPVWGRGVGRLLTEAAFAALAEQGFGEVTLWTPQAYKRARKMYEQAGMRRDGTLRHRRYRGGSFIEVRYRRGLGARGRSAAPGPPELG